MIDIIVGLIILVVSILCMYVQFHMEREKREGKGLPLPWEKGGWMRNSWGFRKPFDKSDIEYRDGDNT